MRKNWTKKHKYAILKVIRNMEGDIDVKKNTDDSPEYQAYIERLSAPPCPRRLTGNELNKLKKEKIIIKNELIEKLHAEALSTLESNDTSEPWDEETQKNWDERTRLP